MYTIKNIVTKSNNYIPQNLWETSKKYGKKVQWNRIANITILIVFSLMILQPHRFEIDLKKNVGSGAVYAQATAQSWEQEDGSVKFDMFIPWWNEEGEIVYEIQSWDTLSEIAKNFGTTTTILIENNNIEDPNNLVSGQQITITDGWWEIIYEVEEKTTVSQFAEENNLNIDDLIELNYFPDPNMELVEGQQLFLDLTREQAELKWLWQQPKYVKPQWLVEELPESQEEEVVQEWWLLENMIGAITWWSSGDLEQNETNPSEPSEPGTPIENLIDNGEPQQKIITAVDTTNQLEEQERALEEAIQNAKNEAEKKKLEEEKRIVAEKLEAEKKVQEKAKKKEQEAAREEAAVQQQVISATETTDSIELANNPPPAPDEIAVDQEVITAEETTKKIEEITSCGENKCLHKGKCRSLPANAYCVPEDDKNAWTCEEGFVDARRSCVAQSTYNEQTSTRGTEPVKSWTISQWYFNPYNDGYGNGWGAWHCTHYSGWYRWKNYGIMTNRRGNGGQRYWNASAAWRQTGKTPEVGSIFVADSGSGRWSAYGHVGIVIKVDWSSNSILVEDMNYAWRYIVTQRWMSMNEKWLIGYIYPRKK